MSEFDTINNLSIFMVYCTQFKSSIFNRDDYLKCIEDLLSSTENILSIIIVIANESSGWLGTFYWEK